MADTTMGTATGTRPALFLRNATGLVKAWSTFDAFIYSFWSINLITLGFVAIVVTMGMEPYARIQKVCFWIGLAGLAVVCGLLLFYSQSDFQNAFNREATSLFGAPANAYQGTIDAASKTFAGSSFGTFAFGPLLLLLPWLAFYLLWPNWGATLYGEVRGAKDIRHPFWTMFSGLARPVALLPGV